MSLLWPCYKFAIGSPVIWGWRYEIDDPIGHAITPANYETEAGLTYVSTPILAGGVPVGIQIDSSMIRHSDCCPIDPEGECPSIIAFVEQTIQLRSCLEYRVTYSGDGCSWFSSPTIYMYSNIDDEFFSVMGTGNGSTDVCMSDHTALEPGPYWPSKTSPYYWTGQTCDVNGYEGPYLRIRVDYTSLYCNNEQEFTLRIEPA